MKRLFALAIPATLSAASLLAFCSGAEAAFFPNSVTMRPLALPAQYSPFQQYGPGVRQDSIAGRAAFCRCYPYYGFKKRLICRYPGRPTTIQIVDRCY